MSKTEATKLPKCNSNTITCRPVEVPTPETSLYSQNICESVGTYHNNFRFFQEEFSEQLSAYNLFVQQ